MVISTYISIIILNVNGLNAKSKDIEWPIENEKTKTNKKRLFNMMPTRNSLQDKRRTETESEGEEKDTSCKRKQQETGGSNIYIR